MQHETALVFPDDVDVSEEAKDLISKVCCDASDSIYVQSILNCPISRY